MSTYAATIPADSTSVILEVWLEDSASLGTGKTALAFGDMTWQFQRQGEAAETAVTPQTMTLGTWATGGFILIDNTNMAGKYQIGIPDAALVGVIDTSEHVEYVDLLLQATGAIDKNIRIQLVRNIYHADIDVRVDTDNTQDEWTIVWNRNGVALTTAGNHPVTVPKLQVNSRAAGTTLFTDKGMTAVLTQWFIYNATLANSEQMTAGEAVVAQATATIDGQTRTTRITLGRDSS